jgi:thiol:disulfide interchange protein
MKAFTGFFFALTITLSTWAEPVSWERDFDQALQKAKAGKKLVMVDIYTDWCGWCKRLDRDVYTNAQVEEKLAKSFVSVKLNPEKGAANTQLARQFGTRGYPHIVFTDADGKKVSEIRGYVAADAFLKHLEQLTVKSAQ